MGVLGRLLTAMVTPFDETGGVDYGQAKRLAVSLLASGSDGLVVAGTTGESPTLTREEKLALFSEVRSAVGDKGAIIAGTGSNSTRESVELTREAEKTGVDGVLLVVPYYNKPTQEGLYQHFRAIAEATRLPCILYNVPSRTITNLAPETVVRLAEVPNIVGVKEASGNLEQTAHIIQGTPRDFRVWSGNDSDTFHIMSLGGYGVISVASHLVGFEIKQMIERCVAGQTSAAAAVHAALLPLVNALFVLSNPIPVKYALNHMGLNVGKPRLPLTEPDEKSADLIRKTLARYKIDLRVPQA
ncbi:MAG: 4-hydroxy-tetrahydrodipicolinate synthase [Dehalococcoidia bacterium]|nr:4-hydroxy-tetrahydrodipicolinate synthase [Dehalococcoidia bacterium]